MLRDYEEVLKAAADPNRARILKMLETGELCVCQIVAVLSLSQSTVSKHLSLLHAACLVEERKDGRWVHFRLAEERANDYALPLLSLVRQWMNRDAIIRTDAKKVSRIRRIPVEKLCEMGPQRVGWELAMTRGGARG